MNVFNEAFPDIASNEIAPGKLEAKGKDWPPIPGDYFVISDAGIRPVAVSTLASCELAEALARLRPDGLCIAGKTETENIGIEKVIKNVIANPLIRVLIIAGQEPKGHHSGSTLLALWKNGVDENMAVIGASGKRPVLKNVTRDEVGGFRKQIKVVDMVGCEDVELIAKRIGDLTSTYAPISDHTEPQSAASFPVIQAVSPDQVELDKAGYFVVIPNSEKKTITVEYYAYDNRLMGVIEGSQARSIYSTIIDKGWLTLLSHAAYLGKELAKAELSIEWGFKYIQDGA